MKRIKNKIVIQFVGVIIVLISITISVVSWHLHKSSAEQIDLLSRDLTTRTFSIVKGYHSIAKDLLGHLRDEVIEYGVSACRNSSIANNIVHHHSDLIADYLQRTAEEAGIDFSLVFNTAGVLQASGAEARGYKPGENDIPSFLDKFKKISVGQRAADILKKEINLEISPMEALKLEESPRLRGFIRLDSDFLRKIGVTEGKISANGAIAIVYAGIIRDEFFVPAGIFICGKTISNSDNFFHALTAAGIATSMYLDRTSVESAGFDEDAMGANNGIFQIDSADAASINKNNQTTNIVLSLASHRYISTCDNIEDINQDKIGILCASLPERQIEEIQKPLFSHSIASKKALQKQLIIIGFAMVFIFIIIARIIAAGITKPLAQVADFTKKVGEGDFSKRFNSSSKDEIGSLSRSIDAMLDKLVAAMAEKERLEGQLRQAHKIEAIGTLAGGIAHDFNNLLTIIIGYTELALDDAPKESNNADNLKSVIEAGNRARNLVQQILAFSRQSEVERFPMLLTPLIKETLKMLRASLPTTIKIKSSFASDCDSSADSQCLYALVDPTQVHQILMNLCTNAGHAMEFSGGILNIELKNIRIEKGTAEQLALQLSPGNYVELIVADNGSGIDPNIIDRIFDPYFTTKEQGKGTGMGLSICHGIISDYGGAISVESELGKGTTFYVYFPAVDLENPEKINENDEVIGGTERVLFVDDEVALAEMGKDVLERLGYSVTVITKSPDALALFENDPDLFDVIITDQTMPGITGSELAQKILAIRPDIPIILCTGYSSLVDEDIAKKIGIKEFVMKPLNKVEIAKLLRKVLG